VDLVPRPHTYVVGIMENNKKKINTSEWIISGLFLFCLLVDILAGISYFQSKGYNCMAGMSLFFSGLITIIPGIISLVVSVMGFHRVRIVFRILGFLPLLYIGLLLLIHYK
jgi:hypothetical protein